MQFEYEMRNFEANKVKVSCNNMDAEKTLKLQKWRQYRLCSCSSFHRFISYGLFFFKDYIFNYGQVKRTLEIISNIRELVPIKQP